MDVLKKKMVAMNFEKKNTEEKSKVLQKKLKQKEVERIAQEEHLVELVKELQIKQQDCDEYQEELAGVSAKLEATEKQATLSETDVAALLRKIVLLQNDLDQNEARLLETSKKLEETSIVAITNEKLRQEIECRSFAEDDKLNHLEESVKEAKFLANEADKKYEEVARKLAISCVDLARTDARLELSEGKINTFEEELMIVGKTLRSLEISEHEAVTREESYAETITALNDQLKMSEQRASEAVRQVCKLESEVDRLEDDLLAEMEKYNALSGELDFAFSELTNC